MVAVLLSTMGSSRVAMNLHERMPVGECRECEAQLGNEGGDRGMRGVDLHERMPVGKEAGGRSATTHELACPLMPSA